MCGAQYGDAGGDRKLWLSELWITTIGAGATMENGHGSRRGRCRHNQAKGSASVALFDTICHMHAMRKGQDMSQRPSLALDKNRELIRQIVGRHRSDNPRVFGSVLRGTDTESSDLDLLIDPQPGATLFDLGAIQIELEESLGISVDVLTPKDLPQQLRERILDEAVPV